MDIRAGEAGSGRSADPPSSDCDARRATFVACGAGCSCETVRVREGAILRLDSGDELRVELERDDLDRDEIVVRRAGGLPASGREAVLAVIDAHLAAARPHAAGTTDRLLEADRLRPF